MNLKRLFGSRRVVADEIETKNWICRRYEVWEGSERLCCKVKRKHKKQNRRGYRKWT